MSTNMVRIMRHRAMIVNCKVEKGKQAKVEEFGF